MAILADVFRNLGMEYPKSSPVEKIAPDPWIMDRAFIPELGKSYWVGFRSVTHEGVCGDWIAKIRIDGPTPGQWIDLDTGLPLAVELARVGVQAHYEI